jgi:hypothetical protein
LLTAGSVLAAGNLVTVGNLFTVGSLLTDDDGNFCSWPTLDGVVCFTTFADGTNRLNCELDEPPCDDDERRCIDELADGEKLNFGAAETNGAIRPNTSPNVA